MDTCAFTQVTEGQIVSRAPMSKSCKLPSLSPFHELGCRTRAESLAQESTVEEGNVFWKEMQQ